MNAHLLSGRFKSKETDFVGNMPKGRKPKGRIPKGRMKKKSSIVDQKAKLSI